jgi:hypothetical protein
MQADLGLRPSEGGAMGIVLAFAPFIEFAVLDELLG